MQEHTRNALLYTVDFLFWHLAFALVLRIHLFGKIVGKHVFKYSRKRKRQAVEIVSQVLVIFKQDNGGDLKHRRAYLEYRINVVVYRVPLVCCEQGRAVGKHQIRKHRIAKVDKIQRVKIKPVGQIFVYYNVQKGCNRNAQHGHGKGNIAVHRAIQFKQGANCRRVVFGKRFVHTVHHRRAYPQFGKRKNLQNGRKQTVKSQINLTEVPNQYRTHYKVGKHNYQLVNYRGYNISFCVLCSCSHLFIPLLFVIFVNLDCLVGYGVPIVSAHKLFAFFLNLICGAVLLKVLIP